MYMTDVLGFCDLNFFSIDVKASVFYNVFNILIFHYIAKSIDPKNFSELFSTLF